MLEYLNQNVIFLKVALTFVTTLVTVILIIFNIRSNRIAQKAVEQLQQIREEEFRPYLYCDFVLREHLNTLSFYFLVRNDGRSSAHNISLTINEDISVWNAYVGDNEYAYKDMGISKGIVMLAPNEEFREWIDHTYLFFPKNEKLEKITGTLTYEDDNGKKYDFQLNVDLEPHKNRSKITSKGIPDLVRCAENFHRAMTSY